jgi:ribonucleoside-triphosphate reductase
MLVIKRNKTVENFDWNKVEKAIVKAFNAVNEPINQATLDEIRDELSFNSITSVEEIQDQIEYALMTLDYCEVAKAFILYRNKQTENRVLDQKVKFIQDYSNASNAATGSKFDPNANVTEKNVATLSAELYKGDIIKLNRARLVAKIRELYGEDLAKEYIRQLESHELYKHDETSLMPYTYSASEVVNVRKFNTNLLLSLSQLYDFCEEEEVLLDEEKDVWGKYPQGLYIKDKDNVETRVTRLVRKKRHRNLVRVKTSFGEDLVVTDNHPLIVTDNREATVDAINSLDLQQYRCPVFKSSWGRTMKLNMKGVSRFLKEDFGDFYTSQWDTSCKVVTCKSELALDEEFGYLVGYFIGDGNFNYVHDELQPFITITQKDKEVLRKLASIAYSHMGISSEFVYKGDKCNCWQLKIYSPDLVWLLKEYFHIGHMAQNKNLPINIYEFTKDFAEGIVAGLIDSDGNLETAGNIMIRLSSRTCIQQLTMLLKQLGFGVANTMQSTPFSNNNAIQQKYTIWGVKFSRTPKTPELAMSFKWKNTILKDKGLKYSDGWSKITNVQTLENDSFLLQNDYIYDITTESHSFICNNLWVHNCVAITMYPFLLNGLKDLGGLSAKPQNLDSFCGIFINLCFAVSSQFAGALATGEFLMYFDYFARKEWGDNYYKFAEFPVQRYGMQIDSEESYTYGERSIEKVIEQKFQQIVYSMNQPAAARGFQSIFWNISYFDKNYFDGMFGEFYFPDGTQPKWESLNWLQKKFMKWFNNERTKTILTFPVETMALLTDGEDVVDKEYADFTAEMYSEGHSFFTYMSDSADSLSSCCRLRNEVTENQFSYSLGAGGIATGSKSVMTLNINRLVQDAVNRNLNVLNYLREQVKKVHKYQRAYNELLKEYYEGNLLPVYKAGFISLEKQYLTVGINGVVEAAEFLGIEVNDNPTYKEFIQSLLNVIATENKKAKTKELMFNTEFVPAEGLGVKHAKWDREAGYIVPRDCYNSYYYKVEDTSLNVLDKFRLHGHDYVKYLDGGSALHMNLEEHLSKEQYRNLLKVAATNGTNYFTFNIPNTICNECGHIDKRYLHECPKCGSKNIDYATRVIGYLKRVSNFSEARQIEANKRFYYNGNKG